MESKSYLESLINRIALIKSEKTALLISDGKKLIRVSYAQLNNDVRCSAGYFLKEGIKGRHVALIAQESYEWIVNLLAIIVSGNTVMPINPSLPKDILQWQCHKADISMICTQENMVDELSFLIKGIEHILFEEIDGSEPVSSLCDIQAYRSMIFLATSGTTGKSKIVELTDENICSGAKNGYTESGKRQAWEDLEDVSIFVPIPLHHAAGLRTLFWCMEYGFTLCLGRGVKYTFMDMPLLNPEMVLFVPSIAESLEKILRRRPTGEWKQIIGCNLKELYVCGAPLKEITAKSLLSKGINIMNMFGMTETIGDGACCKVDEEHLGAIGRPNYNVQMRIEDGELLIKSSGVMKGYYNDQEETEKVIVEGWLHTGDMARCDTDGCFYITGRKKNVILLSNGENVNPEEIEGVLAQCAAVEEIMVYSDEKGICADIFTQNEGEVSSFVKEYNKHVPMYRQVYKVNYQNEPLEKTPSGKIKRKVNL